MAKIQNIYYHHISGSKLPQKMVLAVFTRCLVPEIQILDHFWRNSAFLRPNFSRPEICTAKPMVVGCVQHYSTHFVNKLGKWLESFFRKVKKLQKLVKNGKKMPILAKISKFLEKSGSVTFHPLLVPNFKSSFGKILRAVSEIICYARMDGRTHVRRHKGDFISLVGFQPGTNKLPTKQCAVLS